ncbi:TetR/AcrR family transcriptional regulator [Volucribacter amazonae]|nr:TetR/AcrR family transcriptional regulator [Volucribacter amazonae]
MTEVIFTATERLMAKDGLHHLSMHKIAKEAGISPGTIYIHFKSKEDLLENLAQHIFAEFHQTLSLNHDENQDFYLQYKQFWWNLWNDLYQYPDTILNIHQYRSMPCFEKFMQEYNQSSDNIWNKFCEKAPKAGVLCDLPADILFTLSLESAINLAFKAVYFKQQFSNDLLETVIQRTWLAIQK